MMSGVGIAQALPSPLPPRDERGRYELGTAVGSMSTHGTHYRLEGEKNGELVVLINGIFDPPTRFDLMAPALQSAGYQTLRFDCRVPGLDQDLWHCFFDLCRVERVH